ncbi:TPA: flippase [Photobacterium damselae]
MSCSKKNNLKWLVFDKLIRVTLSFYILSLLANYLGTSNFGQLNYIITINGFLSVLSGFGIYSIVVKDFHDQKKDDYVLSNAIIIQLFSNSILYLFFILSVLYIKPEDYILYVILGTSILFKIFDVSRYYFEYKMEMKKIVISDNLSFIFCSMLKIIAVKYNLSLLAFIIINLLEFVISSTLLFCFLNKVKFNFKLYDFSYVKKLLILSYPLLINSLSIIIFMKIDTLMINYYLGYEDVGLYTAITRLSEFWFFIPVMIAQVINKDLIELKKNGKHTEYLMKILKISCLFTFFCSLFISLFSREIIWIVYGNQYLPASTALSIIIWSGFFVFLSTISGRWLIIESLQKYSMYRTLCGVFINIVCNMILIPLLGINGAAIGTLSAYVIGHYLANYLNSRTRELFLIQTKAIFSIFLIHKYKEMLYVIRKL